MNIFPLDPVMQAGDIVRDDDIMYLIVDQDMIDHAIPTEDGKDRYIECEGIRYTLNNGDHIIHTGLLNKETHYVH